jgi:Hemerythrin HHE cation binding domain
VDESGKPAGERPRGGERAHVIPANRLPLIQSPVDHVFAEHVRIGIALDLLESLAEQPMSAGRGLPEVLSQFFRQDFERHAEDDENDLLPVLQRRLTALGIDGASLDRLRAEYAADRDSLRFIVPLLDRLAAGQPIADLAGWRTVVKSFAESVHGHMDWEYAVVRSLAHLHFIRSDHDSLAMSLALRRGGAKG